MAKKEKSATVECKDCGGTVSREASKCPHCGTPDFLPKKGRPKYDLFRLIGTAFLLIVGFGFAMSFIEPEDPSDQASGDASKGQENKWDPPTESEATSTCHDFARDRLKAPSTAEFPWSAEKVLSNREGDTARYVVLTYVDAQNAMGAQLRKDIRCVLETGKGSDQWTLEKISFQ